MHAISRPYHFVAIITYFTCNNLTVFAYCEKCFSQVNQNTFLKSIESSQFDLIKIRQTHSDAILRKRRLYGCGCNYGSCMIKDWRNLNSKKEYMPCASFDLHGGQCPTTYMNVKMDIYVDDSDCPITFCSFQISSEMREKFKS